MPDRKYKEGDEITVPGYGKGAVIGRPSTEGRVVVQLEDGRRVNYGGRGLRDSGSRSDRDLERRIAALEASPTLIVEPGFAGVPAVGPGDNNAGNPLFRADVDQPLKEQPLGTETEAPGETPEEVAEEEGVATKALGTRAVPGTQRPPQTQDKALRGPREGNR